MRHASPKPFFSAAVQRAVAYGGAIEWEELPSLVGRLIARNPSSRPAGEASHGHHASVWDNTQPAPFDDTPHTQPFRETLSGLATREVTEPDVFRHFFGNDRGL